MYSIAVKSPGEVEVVQLPEPAIGPYDVKIKSEVGFICNATDRKVIEGHFPGIGSDSYPLLLGHETVGTVCEKGEKVQSFSLGERVIGGLLLHPPGNEFGSGWGGNSEYILARDHLAMMKDGCASQSDGWDEIYQIMKPVPEHISLKNAGMLCTWREVYAGLFHDFHLKPGNDIVVFGAGPVGLSFIRFARISGFGRIVCVEPLEKKRDKALAMGADAVYAPESLDGVSLTNNGSDPFDAAIDAVGKNDIIQASLPLISMGGSVCVYGVLSTPEIYFHKDLGPHNFNLLVHQWPTREAEASAHEPLITWIEEGLLDAEDFVTGEFSAKEINKALEDTRKPHSIKTMIRFDQWEA